MRASLHPYQVAVRRRPGHEDEVARVLGPVGGALEVRVDMVHNKAGPRQQVLRLETKDAAHTEWMDQAVLMAVGMGDVVDKLAAVHLADEIPLEHPVSADDRPPVWQGERRLLIDLGTVDRLREVMDGRIEDIEHEPTIRCKMPPDGHQACQLLRHRE